MWGEENPTVRGGKIFPSERLILPITLATEVHLKPRRAAPCPLPACWLHLCLGGICFPGRSPSLWSLLSTASGTKNLLFASSSVHLGWHGGQRVVPAFLPPCSAETLLELVPEAARCLLHNINICGVSTGLWPHTCEWLDVNWPVFYLSCIIEMLWTLKGAWTFSPKLCHLQET